MAKKKAAAPSKKAATKGEHAPSSSAPPVKFSESTATSCKATVTTEDLARSFEEGSAGSGTWSPNRWKVPDIGEVSPRRWKERLPKWK